LHGGHLDMIEAGAKMGDRLVVIVNNDKQQLIKKGKVILDEDNRARLLGALRAIDEVIIAADNDSTVVESLKLIRSKYPDDELVFGNGGDRIDEKVTPESQTCKDLNIQMVFGVGGAEKHDSSTRINQALGHKK
jgi:cytidyltransferase-like protein